MKDDIKRCWEADDMRGNVYYDLALFISSPQQCYEVGH